MKDFLMRFSTIMLSALFLSSMSAFAAPDDQVQFRADEQAVVITVNPAPAEAGEHTSQQRIYHPINHRIDAGAFCTGLACGALAGLPTGFILYALFWFLKS